MSNTDTVTVKITLTLGLHGVPHDTDVRAACARMLEEAWGARFEKLTPQRIEAEEVSRVPDSTGP